MCALAKGGKFGARPSLSKEEIAQLIDDFEAPGCSKTEIAEHYGISRSSVYRLYSENLQQSVFVPTPAGPIHRTVAVYLICGQEVTLIDSGVAGCEVPILACLEAIGRGGELARLLLTHSHPDHIGAARALRMNSAEFQGQHT